MEPEPAEAADGLALLVVLAKGYRPTTPDDGLDTARLMMICDAIEEYAALRTLPSRSSAMSSCERCRQFVVWRRWAQSEPAALREFLAALHREHRHRKHREVVR